MFDVDSLKKELKEIKRKTDDLDTNVQKKRRLFY